MATIQKGEFKGFRKIAKLTELDRALLTHIKDVTDEGKEAHTLSYNGALFRTYMRLSRGGYVKNAAFGAVITELGRKALKERHGVGRGT